MPYRLVIRTGDSESRYILSAGDNVLGTAPDCTLCLSDPTVSRHHAVLVINDGRVEVEDLGSRNGTTVHNQRVRGRQFVRVGEQLAFGCVSAYLEEVPTGELEPAVLFGSSRDVAASSPGSFAPPVTDSLGSLVAFVMEHLPAVAGRLAAGADEVAVAQTAGAALFQALPCLAVEVARCERCGGGVLFRAERADGGDGAHPVEETVGNLTVKACFASGVAAKSYEPLVRTAALLIASSQRRDLPGIEPERLPIPPALPDPPTVVPEVRAVYADAARVAGGDISVLITGESGTGKEVLARFIHSASRRSTGPFIALNCAALPRDLLEAELFGIERGVATGVDSRPGKFELAHGGTLFLDEIGDMPPEVQAKLLRVLQEGQVCRIGGREPRPAQTRIISATNRDIDALLAAGAFRVDLYHRIGDWRANLPPLRRRRADIPNLAAHFLARESMRRHIRPAGISRAALDVLAAHAWPGNLRQLEREMARAALFVDDGQLLETRHLQPAISSEARCSPKTLAEILEEVERREIVRALEVADGDTAQAAQALGIARSTLYRRMKDLGASPPGD